MVKLLLIVGALVLLWRLAFGNWPWNLAATKRTPDARVESVREARRILGVRENANRDTIADAHRKLAARHHPDRGGDPVEASRINAARDLLIGRPVANSDEAEK